MKKPMKLRMREDDTISDHTRKTANNVCHKIWEAYHKQVVDKLEETISILRDKSDLGM